MPTGVGATLLFIPDVISGSSSVTGTLQIASGSIPPAEFDTSVISGSSSVSGILNATFQLSNVSNASSLRGQSSLTSSLSKQADLQSSITSVSSISASLSDIYSSASTIASVTSISASLVKTADLQSSISLSSLVFGSTSATFQLSTHLTGITSAPGALDVQSPVGTAPGWLARWLWDWGWRWFDYTPSGGGLSASALGTSSVSGALGTIRELGGALSGSSSLVSTLNTIFPIQGSLTDASTIAGSLARQVDLQGTITFASDVSSANLVKILDLRGVIFAGTNVSSALVKTADLRGDTAGLTSVAGTVGNASGLSGSILCSTDVSASLVKTADLQSIVADSTSVSGRLSDIYSVVGSAASVTSVSGVLSDIYSVIGSIASDTSISASLVKTADLQSSIISTTSVSASLVKTADLRSAATFSSIVTGAVANASGLTGDILSPTSVSGALVKIADLRGSILSTTSVAASAGRILERTGDVSGTSSINVSLNTARGVSGIVSSSEDAQASLHIIFSLLASATQTQSLVSAELYVNRGLVSLVTGSSTVSGQFAVREQSLGGSASGSSVVSGAIERWRTMTASVSGAASVDISASQWLALVGVVDGLAVAPTATLNANRVLRGSSFGSSDVPIASGQLRSVQALASSDTYVRASLARRVLIDGFVYGRSKSTVRTDWTPGFAHGQGFVARPVVVSNPPLESLPEWIPADRDQYSHFGALWESLSLAIDSRSPFEYGGLNVASGLRVLWVVEWLSDTEIREVRMPDGRYVVPAQSPYELRYSPFPTWWYSPEERLLYISGLDIGIEQAVRSGSIFQLQNPLTLDLSQPVWLIWSRGRADLAYLVYRTDLVRDSFDRVTGVHSFGYLLQSDSGQYSYEVDTHQVPRSSKLWLAFTSSDPDGDDASCTPYSVSVSPGQYIVISADQPLQGDRVVRSASLGVGAASGIEETVIACFVGDVPGAAPAFSEDTDQPALGQVFRVVSGRRIQVPSGASRVLIGTLASGAYRFRSGVVPVRIELFGVDGAVFVGGFDPNRRRSEETALVNGVAVSAQALTDRAPWIMRWMEALLPLGKLVGWSYQQVCSSLMFQASRRLPLPLPVTDVFWWDGSPVSVPSGSVEVLGVPQTVRVRAKAQRLPYYADGQVLVDDREYVSAQLELDRVRQVDFLARMWQVTGTTLEATSNLPPGVRPVLVRRYQVEKLVPQSPSLSSSTDM